jgi:hypothetical protein
VADVVNEKRRVIDLPEGLYQWPFERQRSWVRRNLSPWEWESESRVTPDQLARRVHVRRLVKVICRYCGELLGSQEEFEDGELWKDPDGGHWSARFSPGCSTHGDCDLSGLDDHVVRARSRGRVVTFAAKPLGIV